MANITLENINTLAKLATSISDGDYIYIYKAASNSFSRIEKSMLLQDAEGGFPILDTNTGDLEFADQYGHIIMRLVNGHVKTKNFDSSSIDIDLSNYYTKAQVRDLINAIEQGGDVDLSDYYTKDEVDALIANKPLVTPPENLKILFLGNSFTTGTFSYLPFILKNYGINITIHILYAGGAGINTYNNYFTTANKTMYSINTETDSAWNTTTNQSASAIVASKPWDMIVLQQSSTQSYTYSNYSNVSSLIAKVRNAATNANAKIGWVINHIGPSSFTNGTDNRPNVVDCCKRAIEENNIDFVFPYGTAIFNLMDKYSSLGDGTYMTYEGLHLQEGFPLYVASLANLQALFATYYPDISVNGDIFVPDTTHRNNASGHVKGDLIGMSDWATMSRIAQFAALGANRNKYTINPII